MLKSLLLLLLPTSASFAAPTIELSNEPKERRPDFVWEGGDFGPIDGVTFTPDGRHLVSLQNRVLRFWNLQDGSLLHDCKAEFRSFSAVEISPDGRFLALSGRVPEGVCLLRTADL